MGFPFFLFVFGHRFPVLEERQPIIGEKLTSFREPEEPEPFLPSGFPSKEKPISEWNQKIPTMPIEKSKQESPIRMQEVTSAVST